MNTSYKEPNVHVITRMVIIGAVGIIALALGWLALNKNTERRSKAALTEATYKSWEFRGTADGWIGENSTELRTSPDALVAVFPGNTVGSLRQDQVTTALPYGNKYVKVILSLTPGISVLGTSDETVVGVTNPETGPLPTHAPVPTGCQPMPPCVQNDTCNIPPPEDGWCPPQPTRTPTPTRRLTPTPTRRPQTPTPLPRRTTFSLTARYLLRGGTEWQIVTQQGVVSIGNYAEYALHLPPIAPISVDKLKLQLSNVRTSGMVVDQDYTLRINRIRLTGPVPSATPSASPSPTRTPTPTRRPTPTPACTPPPPCIINNTCNIPPPSGGWCPLTPTPTRRPTPTPTRRPTPTPTEGASALNEGQNWTCQQFPDASWCQ